MQDLAEKVPHDVTVVVSDPPWNEFTEVADFDEFLLDMCVAFTGLADPSGGMRVVLLMNRRNTSGLGPSLDRAGFGHIADDPVLVNGHPASVVTARL